MNSVEIVDRILETGVADFIGDLPSGFWDTFHHTHIMSDADFRKSRTEAASDLWKFYKRQLDNPVRVRP